MAASVSIFGLHRNAGVWEQPNDFLHERFADRSRAWPVYLPFSIGPHGCLGRNFAMLQMQALLILFCQKFYLWSLDYGPQHAIAQVTLRSLRSPRVLLRERA